MTFKKPFDKPKRLSIKVEGKSRTFQEFKNECNINNILAKYQKQGVLEHFNKHQGDYSDYTNVQDYHSSYNQIIAAQDAFNDLPSSVRKRFNNDPGSFLEFVGNPDNVEEMCELGLAKPREEAVPVGTPIPEVDGNVSPEDSQEAKN